MLYLITKLKTNDEGATAIEYGLIAALVAVAAIGGLTLIGGNLETLFQDVGSDLS
ncbi:Flp family type IVb pilin [Roseovarius sp. D22-M7]|uniref:Flp family type IVb pilin n=1 Tax=Roseovarius sp. D22-M7 TaxID=3127116 RepID=UPI00300F816A